MELIGFCFIVATCASHTPRPPQAIRVFPVTKAAAPLDKCYSSKFKYRLEDAPVAGRYPVPSHRCNILRSRTINILAAEACFRSGSRCSFEALASLI